MPASLSLHRLVQLVHLDHLKESYEMIQNGTGELYTSVDDLFKDILGD